MNKQYNRCLDQQWLRLMSLVCIIGILVLSLPAAAAVEGEVPQTVKVGYYENEVFQEGASEDAVKTGYAYEYYRKLSEYTGWNYEYVYGSFSDLYRMLQDGEVDLLAGLAYKEDRADIIGYPDLPMGSENYNLIKHSADISVTAEPSTMNGLTFGVLNSAMLDILNGYLNDHRIEANVITYDDYSDLFDDFDAGKIDILAAEGDGVYDRKDAEIICSYGSSSYYLCVNIRRQDLLDELNTAQTMLAASEPNYLHTLNAKYYSVGISARALTLAESEWLDNHSELRVGYLEDYLPYSDTDKDGSVTGMLKDYLPALLDSIGAGNIKIIYRGYKSYDEMIDKMRSDEIDAAFPVGGGLYFSEENDIYQSNPVISSSMQLVFNDEYRDDVTSHFAVNENNQMQYYYIKTYYPDAEVTFYSSVDECLKALSDRKVTCTMLNGLGATEILRNSNYSRFSLRPLPHNDDRCIGVEIGNEGLLRLLNRGINILGSDYGQNLSYSYIDALYSVTLIDMLRQHIVLFITVILLIAALIFFLLFRDSMRKKKQISETEEARRELEEKNEELARSKEALSDALIAAEHANRAKTIFLNNMSHDIRTPMNAIVGFTAMAATHIDNKEQVQDYLGKISISSRHLLSLINDVLDMSRIESGKIKIEETEVHLPDMIHDLRTIIQANVKAKKQELFIDTQDVRNEDIIIDKLRLNQVLLNILTNAVKFTPAGGTISFRVIEKPCSLEGKTNFEFRIKDNGIGMSKEFQKSIFDAFSRERNSTVSNIQGTGLGMAIAKNIVDMMGGTITVISAPDKGSEFVVNITCRISEEPTEFADVPELAGLRALVADDDTDSCLSLCTMLRDIGMRPDWTNYGKEAVIRAKEAFDNADKFSVYIIDWLMPDLNGIETVRRIRKVIGNDDPIIILTAYDWTDIEQEAREAGVTDFVSKPLFMSELRSALSKPFRITEPTVQEEETAVYDFTGKRVLLAEDNELNQMIAVSILEGAGFTVDIAPDGSDAVRMITDNPAGFYDIVLMDIQMPQMDGYTAAQKIRAMGDPQKATVPIIAVTANAFDEDRKIALEAGMNGHLAKPYDIPMMMETIHDLLDQSSLRG